MVYRFLLLFFVALLLPLNSYSSKEYVVKKGDNLYDISKKLGVSIDDLKKENNLKNSGLDIGDKLLIPGSTSRNSNSNNIYVVKSGDTLSEIAEKHGVLTNNLKKENNLKNSNLKIGQKLKIPSSEKAEKKALKSEKTAVTWDASITIRPKDDPSSPNIEEIKNA